MKITKNKKVVKITKNALKLMIKEQVTKLIREGYHSERSAGDGVSIKPLLDAFLKSAEAMFLGKHVSVTGGATAFTGDLREYEGKIVLIQHDLGGVDAGDFIFHFEDGKSMSIDAGSRIKVHS